MKTPASTIQRIVKNGLLSLLIYALPVVLMFLTFYLRGERPWKKAKQEASIVHQNK